MMGVFVDMAGEIEESEVIRIDVGLVGKMK